VGTGSGAIAISIAAERPLASVTATDLSAPALEVARKNAEAHDVAERIRFLHADLLNRDERYDLIVSNPPYIARDEIGALQAEVRDHEPLSALEAGDDGLDVVRALLLAAAPATSSGAQLLIEIGAEQGAAVSELVGDGEAWELIAIHLDLGRRDRVVHLRRI
jgi:release factor glutamine methyltransferase